MDSRELARGRACTDCPFHTGLPPEIWAKIRDYMEDMKDWARVSGTCRCMWNLPLSTVDINIDLPLEGVEWAAKRWHAANALRIQGETDAMQLLARWLPQGCTDLASVRDLVVNTCYGDGQYEACPKYMTSLFHLLAHLSGLRTLNLIIYDLQILPPLSGLKELTLSYTTRDNARGVEISPDSLRDLLGRLKELSGLEKLSLDASPISEFPLWVDQWAPVLDLASLPMLMSVHLYCFAPEGIILPTSCQLHLRLCQKDSVMDLGKWLAVYPNICLLSLQDRDMDMDTIPHLLSQDLPSLESVTLSVSKIGGSNASLRGVLPGHGLMHVKALQLVADRIRLHIPANVAWKDLRVQAFELLSFTFEDVAAFVRQIARFEICYNVASGSFLAELFCEMGKQGLHWTATQTGGYTRLRFNIAKGELFDTMSPIDVTCLHW